MGATIFCYAIIGLVVGFLFSFLFISFDKAWKKIMSWIFGGAGTGGGIFALDVYFKITDTAVRAWSVSLLLIMFLISFAVMMLIMCKVIRDKDDADVLRIRDILLGQKSYIDKYYINRAKEIDSKLNIALLEEREKNVSQREEAVISKEQYVIQELEKISQLGNKKVKFFLPENRQIIITQNFISSLPSYIGDFLKCINDIKYNAEVFKNGDANLEHLKSYLLSVSSYLLQQLFGGSRDIRVHFRYYNEVTGKYEKLVAVSGKTVVSQNMTPIPYQNSMIQKSFECKRALIKSINSDYDYKSNNNVLWQDYMTYAFYNLTRNRIPYLTFGISVKNATRFKEIFYFLNFVGLETYLNEYIESVEQNINFEEILYGKGGECNV